MFLLKLFGGLSEEFNLLEDGLRKGLTEYSFFKYKENFQDSGWIRYESEVYGALNVGIICTVIEFLNMAKLNAGDSINDLYYIYKITSHFAFISPLNTIYHQQIVCLFTNVWITV